MAVEIEIIQNGRVVIAHYSGQMTAGDIATVVDGLSTTLNQALLPVHNITDLLGVTAFPHNTLSVVRGFRNILGHRMMGTFVVATSNAFYLTIVKALTRIVPVLKVQVVKTLPEALAEIDKLVTAEVPR